MNLRNLWSSAGWPAAVGALVIAALAWAAGAAWWLAVLLGLLAFAVIAALRARTKGDRYPGDQSGERARLAYEASIAKTAALRALAGQEQHASSHELAIRICDHAAAALAVMEDERKQAAAPLLLEHILEPAEGVLETYLHVISRGIAGTEAMARHTESFELPAIERAARAFAEKLAREERVDLAALEQILAFDLETTRIVEPPGRDSSRPSGRVS